MRSFTDYIREKRHELGINKPMSENKECSAYLGVHIAENILSVIFNNIKRMPYGNIGYDFICEKMFKIDVKCAVLTKDNRNNGRFMFSINKNIFADYFLLLAFDNRKNLTPLHLWLIGGNELVGVNSYKKILNNKKNLVIYDTNRSICLYEQYNQNDKFNKLQCLCEGKIP